MASRTGEPSGRRTLRRLQRFESRNITFVDPDGSWPIVWNRARGMSVWDVAGRRFLDLTAAFGVAAAGHAHPEVVRAGQIQLGRLPHAMGDVHPHPGKAELAERLSRLTFGKWRGRLPRGRTGTAVARRRGSVDGKVIFCNSGFEAVEAALKTARLATGRSGVLAFNGAYHGVGYGTLNATHREHFRGPFLDQLGKFGRFTPFPDGDEIGLDEALEKAGKAMARGRIGAVLVEPMQARGGIRIPPRGFLKGLRALADRFGALLVADEIYTGFGRTGAWFACEHEGVVPDVICLGKALTGGFPMSACVGRAEVMDLAWPPSNGEAIHTSTFLGNPVGCAMALAQIRVLERDELPTRSATVGDRWLGQVACLADGLWPWELRVRGSGLMIGMEFRHRNGRPAGDVCLRLVKALLKDGIVALPEGLHGEVLGLTPPLIISERECRRATKVIFRNLEMLAAASQRGGRRK